MGIQSNIATGKDVIAFLKAQHEDIKGHFTRVLVTTGDERRRAFYRLRRLMAVHETAEEQIVHPAAAQKLGARADGIIDVRLAEERRAKVALMQLEELDVDSNQFEGRLRTLRDDVLAHAASEETLEFDRLGEALDATHLARMRRAVEFVEAIAPTRPHPGIESPMANMLMGPFASIVDRTRDALMRRH